jgi:hypothetical protein
MDTISLLSLLIGFETGVIFSVIAFHAAYRWETYTQRKHNTHEVKYA